MLGSKHLPELVKDVTLGTSIPGVVLSVLFLAAVAYLQWNPVSRPHLDRVSFRLLVYALIANVVFGSLMFLHMEETSPGCTLVAFLYGTAPLFSAWIFCCIALNLQLVLIFGVNGNKMEKYYLLGAAILCGVCNIPPWVAGKFGWDATTGKCWLRDPLPTVQQRWIIGTRSVPTILMSVLEVFSFVNILIFMLLQLSKIERLRADTSGSAIVSLASALPKHPILQFRPIIMRIALYPLLSCFLSITVCILSVYTGMHQNPTDFHINLRIFNACVYSIRPLLYALLAAIDPSFLRAVRSLRAEPLSQRKRQTATTFSFGWAPMQLAGNFSGTSSAEQEKSSAGDCERRPPTVEEARSEEELQSEKIVHQI